MINSDISDEGFFEEESLKDHDLIITTTANQELNILAAIYAKTYGIKRSIALVNRYNYLTLANRLGVDVIISPRTAWSAPCSGSSAGGGCAASPACSAVRRR